LGLLDFFGHPSAFSDLQHLRCGLLNRLANRIKIESGIDGCDLLALMTEALADAR
jgi:hypothetical protein